MGWSRRPQSPNNDSDSTSGNNPLADNMRLNQGQRPNGATEPLPTEHNASIYDQQTVVDSNFSNRSQARRQRQAASPFNTQRIGTWAADPGNSRTMLMIGAAVVITLLLIGAVSIYNRLNRTVPIDGETTTASQPAGASTVINEGAAASANAGVGTVPQPVATIPGSDPAQQSAAGATGGTFVVTGTGTDGLFLRRDAVVDPGNILGTLPDGTKVDATGETKNDGTREWKKVRTQQFGEGWVAAQYLQPAQ